MSVLIEFLLTQIGVPLIAQIIKQHQTANNGTWPTPEQVAQTFIDTPAMWANQGNDWLAANPKQV